MRSPSTCSARSSPFVSAPGPTGALGGRRERSASRVAAPNPGRVLPDLVCTSAAAPLVGVLVRSPSHAALGGRGSPPKRRQSPSRAAEKCHAVIYSGASCLPCFSHQGKTNASSVLKDMQIPLREHGNCSCVSASAHLWANHRQPTQVHCGKKATPIDLQLLLSCAAQCAVCPRIPLFHPSIGFMAFSSF